MKPILASAAAFAALVAPAFAEERHAYVAGFAGTSFSGDETLNGANAAGQARAIEVALEDGGHYGLALGVASADASFGRFRAEVEASFRSADVEGLKLNGVARTVGGGSDVSVTAGMVNVFYDTPVYFERLRLSAGVGFGIANIDHEIRYLVANAAAIGASPGNLQIAIPSTESTYAYQVIGGAEIALTPRVSITGDVRYFDLGDVQAERYILNSIINGVATTNGTLDSILDADYSATSVTVGLRVKF